MMQKLNLGIGVATARGGTQEDVQGHAETINQSQELRGTMMFKV